MIWCIKSQKESKSQFSKPQVANCLFCPTNSLKTKDIKFTIITLKPQQTEAKPN